MGSSTKRNRGNPQVEDGYVRIATELFEQLYAMPFTCSQLKIILFVIRNTYGFHRKTHEMSAGYISRGTGLSIRTVKREIKHLEELKVITVSHNGLGVINRIGINKKYQQWNIKPVPSVTPCHTRHRGSAMGDTVTSDTDDTVASAMGGTQHNIEEHKIDKQRIDKDKESLPTLAEMGIPDDWEHLMPEKYVIDYRYKKLKRVRDGVLFSGFEIDWKGLRE